MERDILDERVDAWVRGGVVTPEQAEAILAFERRSGVPLAGPVRPDRRARLAEVVGYVGAAFALGAVGLLLAETWPDLLPWARALLAALLTGVTIIAGSLVTRGAGSAARRLAGVLWACGVAGTAWLAGILATDVLTVPDRVVPLVVGLSAAVIGAVLLAVGRHVLVQIATLIALAISAGATLIIVAPLPPGPTAFGILILGGGASWALAGAGGWLGPRVSAELSGGVVALVGTQVLASGRPLGALVVGVVTASLLVVASLSGQRVHLLILGAVGLFVTVPRLVFGLFADTLGAPATLLTTGVLLILLAAGLTRVRRAQSDPRSPSDGQEVAHG